MGAAVGVIAFVIALVGLVAALGHVGYLAMLNSAARKRGASGQYAIDYVGGRWKVAGITSAVAAFGLLLTSGGLAPDVLGMIISGGAGVVAQQQLESTRKKFRGEA
ncbi:hypothetical protein [Pseudonocardia humida]|uniref:SdpI/YhfL family protein n=1 Tax=Pseudonocardia humida TaxID=2800819 RepID=A0ABT0ZVX4_9PSEU|nr:hypothetical protein [Pseudonocardia humida]MCO1654893.1 hypothetical protein [Pseudonocardia humida]